MTERVVHGEPSSLPTMLKAALPVLPGVNLIPGIAKKGAGQGLPDLTLRREAVSIDAAHVASYAEVCGFEPSQSLPFTYPHMLAFPLHMGIMTDGSFPYPAIGSVHLATPSPSTARSRPPRPSTSRPGTEPPPPRKGKVFDLVTEVSAGGETVWESTSTYLRVGRGDETASPEGEPFDLVPSTGVEWKLPGDLGRRYAAVSGDHNPIHLYPLTAKAFGFKRQIAHGMWSKARCVAAFASRLPDAATVEVEFRKPIFLPGKVAFGSKVTVAGAVSDSWGVSTSR